MSRLLREIKQQDKYAASVLEGAGLHTDSDIQMLTREALNELFPGHEKFKLRRTIFEIIHKEKPVDQVLKELKEFIPRESLRAALTNNGVLVDYLPILKEMKTQMNHVQNFLDAHICLLEEFSTNQPNQQSATCGPDPLSHYGQPDGHQQGAPGEVMSRLLSQIKQQDEAAFAVLERAGLSTDSDIQMLTIEDLCELFPGPENIKLGKTIFEIIHKQKPVDQVLKELKEFIPRESFRDALTKDGVLVDYRPILKDMKTQMNHVQSFLDAHDSLLEEFSTNQPDQQSDTCGQHPESHNGQPDGRQQGAPGTNTSANDEPMDSDNGQSDGGSQGARGPSTSATGGPMESLNGPTDGGSQGTSAKLMYRMVVSGKTFSALMQRVKDQVQLAERDQDHEITFVCPIGSRYASDVEAAMTDVKATDDPMDSNNGQSDGGSQGARGTSTSATGWPMEFLNGPTEAGPQGARAKLMYRMVVSGKTFGALMQRVKDQVQNQLQLFESSQDHEITFVCPIGSRYASDVEAAMTYVKATDDLMDSNNGQSDGGSQGTRDSLPGGGTSYASGEMKLQTVQTGACPQGGFLSLLPNIFKQKRSSGPSTAATDDLMEPEAGSQRATAKLKYRMVVSGKTFGAHLNLMQRVKNQVQNQLQLDESSQDHEIIFLFCPICSRVASDVEAAMTDVKDDKPVILVLMHHTREVKYTSSLQTWRDDINVVLFINVFYHETIGLLNCEENNAAVSKIQKDLLERFFPGSIDSSGNAQGVGAGGLTGNNWKLWQRYGF